MSDEEWKETYWKTNKKRWIHSLHGMCSYLAMFPPSLPNYFIKQFTNEGDKVFDPFAGRGTTPLEACLNGRVGIGNDLSPLAQILTGAKVNVPKKEKILERLDALEKSYTDVDISNVDENIKNLFDTEITLPQLEYLKRNLNEGNSVDKFIIGTILGILHGRGRRDGSSLYLSSSMPNTFAMSPNYLKSYKINNNIVCPKQNVFNCIRYKIDLLYKRDIKNYTKGKVYRLNALNIANNKHIFKDNEIDLICTSPPYLKVINYGTYNWIRLWFLNKNVRAIDEKLKFKRVDKLNKEFGLSDDLGINAYLEFMKNVICSQERILKKDGTAIFVIGDVANYHDKYIKLGEEVWNYTKRFTNFKCYDIIEDSIDNKNKVTKIWGNNKGNATKVERILILTKGELRRPNYSSSISDTFNYF
jgi:site-specific DNA-methyltransferase (adenine-specific)